MNITQQLNLALNIAYKKMNATSEQARKELYKMIYSFYIKDIKSIRNYLVAYMTGNIYKKQFTVYNTVTNAYEIIDTSNLKLFSMDTATIMPSEHRDIINKVLKNICPLYSYGVDRYLMLTKPKKVKQKTYNIETDSYIDEEVELQAGDIDEEATNQLMNIYKDLKIDIVAKKWYRMAKLFGIVGVMPVFRNGKLEIDIYTPDILNVIEKNNDYQKAEVVAVDSSRLNNDNILEEIKIVWSETEHYIMVEKAGMYVKQAVESGGKVNSDFKNPYGVLPIVFLRTSEGNSFWGEPMLDLVEQNIWYDIKENNLSLVEIFQGLGIILGVNLGTDEKIPITPYMILNYNQKTPDFDKPDIKSISTNAPLQEIKANNDKVLNTIGMLQGISSYLMDSENKAGYKTGLSKAYDKEEGELVLEEDTILLRYFEIELFEVIRKVLNYHASELKQQSISDELKFNIDFIKPVTTLTLNDKQAKWKFELSEGIKTKVDYLIAENPELTEAEAVKILKRNETLNKIFNTKQEVTDPVKKEEVENKK